MTIDQDECARRRRWATEMCGLLAELDPVEREAVTLSYFRRLTVEEISSRMALPAASVRTAVAVGLSRLATAIAVA